MKKHMDKDTIVYVGNGFSFGYNFELMKKKPQLVDKRVLEATKVYYKVGEKLDTWVDYQRAIQNNVGSHQERLEKALKNPNMTLSNELYELPETIYCDIYENQYKILPNDGKSLGSFWHERIDYFIDTPVYKPTLRQINYSRAQNHIDLPVYEIDLEVEFKQPVTDSLITLNGFYLPYDELAENVILFRGIKNFLSSSAPLDDMDRYTNYYDYEVAVHKWKGVRKEKVLKPYMLEGRTLTFREKINQHGFLMYNGLLYNYDLVKENESDTESNKIMLRLDEIDYYIIDELVLKDFTYIQFGLENPISDEIELKRFEIYGINNILPEEVEFNRKIKDAMIVCNHLNFSYHFQDAYTIKYPDGINGICDFLDNETPVKAIFLITGKKGITSAGYDNAVIEDEMEFEDIIKREYEPFFNDYQDILTLSGNKYTPLYIKYKPINGTLRLFINGVRYDENIHFKYDSINRAIVWLFDKSEGGFDLKEEFQYTAVYDMKFYENGISDIRKFIKDYKTLIKKRNLGF